MNVCHESRQNQPFLHPADLNTSRPCLMQFISFLKGMNSIAIFFSEFMLSCYQRHICAIGFVTMSIECHLLTLFVPGAPIHMLGISGTFFALNYDISDFVLFMI